MLPPSQLAHFADENPDVVNTVVESWVSEDLFDACAPVELVSEHCSCQTGMTAIVIADVNTGCTLEYAHRPQMLAALNERSLSVRRPPFPRIKTTGDVCIDDLVVLSALQFSDVHVKSSRIEMQRADGVSGTLDGRIPLMLVTMLVAAVGRGIPVTDSALTPAVFASAHALPKLYPLQEALSASFSAGEHVRKLEPSGAFSCSEINSAVENETLQMTTRTKAIPRRQRSRYCLVKTPKTIGGTIRQTGRMIGHPHHVSLATIPPLLLRIGSVRHLNSLCLRDPDRTTGETICDSERHGPKRRPPLQIRDNLQAVLPLTALRYDAAVSLFEAFLRVNSSHEFRNRVNHNLTDM